MKRKSANSILRELKKEINRFDYDFDSPTNFLLKTIEILYGNHKSNHANKIVSEFADIDTF